MIPALPWSRPVGARHYCAVVEIHASVVTACRGRWSELDERQSSANPPAALRCGGCVRALMHQALVDLRGAQATMSERVRDAAQAYDSAAAAFVDFMIEEALRVSAAEQEQFPDAEEYAE